MSGTEIISIKSYLKTFGVLVALTFLNLILAMPSLHLSTAVHVTLLVTICSIQVILLGAVFMGLRKNNGFSIALISSCVMFILIFISFTLADVLTRGWANREEAKAYKLNSPVRIIPAGEHKAEH
jgi:heme/copper-type cytochrome/quinol oxidase subunit 4